MNEHARLDSDRFSPGEWTTEYDGSLVMGGQIVSSGVGPDTADRAELKANNRLISAAPNLLAVSRRLAAFVKDLESTHCGLEDYLRNWPTLHDDLNAAEAAIAKAT
jgi:hypothetical protein